MHFDPRCSGEKLLPQRSIGVLVYHSPVVFLDCRHPRFRNFNSTVPVDVIRVKSYVDSFLDPTGVPVRVSINKHNLVPKWWVCSETAEVWVEGVVYPWYAL